MGNYKASRHVLAFLAVLGAGFLSIGGLALSAAHNSRHSAPSRADVAAAARLAHRAQGRTVTIRRGHAVRTSRRHVRVIRLHPRIPLAKHRGSLLGVPWLPHGPKQQLAAGTGSTLRVKHTPVRHGTTMPMRRAIHTSGCAVPSAPGSPAATGGANSANITWTAANGNGNAVTAYVVTAFSGATAKNAQGTPATATSTAMSGIAGGSYTFQIFAQNTCGNGPAATSSAATVTGGATYASTVMGLGPSAYFRFGEAATSVTAADSSGHGLLGGYHNDGNILLGSPGAIAGDSNTGIKDNDGQWVASVPAPANLPVANQPRTVQAWVKPVPGDTACRWILGFGANGTNTAYNLAACPNQIGISAYSDDLYFTTPEPLQDGAWHMITVTYDGTTVTAYEDGHSLGTKTFGSPLSTAPGGLALGSWTAQCCNAWTYGGLDEEAVFPTALTAAQVSSEFAASGYGVPTAPTSPTATSPSNNTATVGWTASTAPGTGVTGYVVTAKKGATFEQSIAAPAGATGATLTGLPSGAYTFTITPEDAYGAGPSATTSSTNVAGSATTFASTVVTDKPAVFWRLDEPSTTTLAADSSGLGILGQYANSCLTLGVAGPLGNDPATGAQSSACNNIASEASRANLPSGSSSRTAMAWILPTDGYCRWFMGWGGNFTDGEFALASCANAINVSLNNDDHSFYSARNIADGNWHLVVVTDTYSTTTGNSVTAYVDGQKLGTQATNVPNTQSGSGLDVGNRPATCCYYGKVADAAVFPKALSAAQITALQTASGDGVPTAPGSVGATGAANKATVTWTAASAPGTTVTNYVVTEYSGTKAQQSVAVPGTATSATIDSLPAGSYTFKVVAYDTYGAGPSATSPAATVTGASTTYASQVIASTPSLYYRLGETGTLVAGDSSGHGTLGSYFSSGVTQGVAGAISDSSDLAASMNSSFLVDGGGSATIPSGDSNRTVEAWVKPSDASCRYVASFGTYQTDQAFDLGECPNAVWIDGYNDAHYFYTPRTLDDGAWHFLVATYSDTNGADQVTAYLDGKSLGTQQFNGTLATPPQSTLVVGEGPNNCCGSFYGGLDEVAVFPSALAATAIAAEFGLSNHAVPAAPTGVTAAPSSNQATVSWTAPTSPDPLTGYIVTAYAGTTPKGSIGAPGSATSATITGLPGGVAYTFKVVAYDAYGPGPAGTSSAQTPTGSATTYASTVLGDSPLLDYRLAEPTGSPFAADSSPSANPANYNNSVTTFGVAGAIPGDPATGVSDNGGDAVAYNQTVPANNLPAANLPRSVVVWVKLGDNNCRYAWGYGSGGTAQGFGVYVCPNSIDVVGNSDDEVFGTTHTMTDGSWHQIVVTFDGTNVTGYVDGVNLGTQQPATTLNTPVDTNLYIGGGPNDAGNRWYGSLDDMAVFSTVLSPAQVTALFTASGYSVPTAPGSVTASPGANQATVNWTAATATNASITGYVVTAMVGGTTAANAVATSGTASSVTLRGLKGGQAYTFQVVALDQYGAGPGATSSSVTTTGTATTYASTAIADGAVAYYRLGETTGNFAADSSGNGVLAIYNLGTTNLGGSSALTHDSSSSITEFNGGGYDVSTPAGTSNVLPSGNAARSVAIWIKPNDSSCREFIGWGYTSSAQGFGLGDACSGANSILVSGWGDDLEFTTAINLHDGNWHQVVATYDGAGNVTAYVDGTSLGTQALPIQLNTPAKTSLYIGSQEDAYSSWYGGLQDAAVFPTALTAAQVTTLYGAR